MKAIYFSDLAQQYFPQANPRGCVTRLHNWIELNKELVQALEKLHYVPKQRALTPLQHEAIIKYLGEPGE